MKFVFTGRPLSLFQALLCLALMGFGMSAHANNNNTTYNEGLLAAESGDYQKAVSQWQALAGQGHASAQFNMALLYHSGAGVELDEAKAVELYHQAAKNGDYYAQEYLAVGYQEGWFGLHKDSKKAAYWQQQLDMNH